MSVALAVFQEDPLRNTSAPPLHSCLCVSLVGRVVEPSRIKAYDSRGVSAPKMSGHRETSLRRHLARDQTLESRPDVTVVQGGSSLQRAQGSAWVPPLLCWFSFHVSAAHKVRDERSLPQILVPEWP
ncbi:hypothetical protein E2C01_040646 [Portunus trituberculatus]|uniref:Uncharacterized protein n=1 Tax=Portunus trituberculatus TaxID=210409 RepID=A0A5B7FRB9_PORTR|nr:hypothetical protein [Portunus trituberculatus]